MFKKRFLDERGLALLWKKIQKYVTQNFVSINESVIMFVKELPSVGDSRYIYLVPNDSDKAGNRFDEYVWDEDNEEFEQVGVTEFGLATQTSDGLMSAEDKKKLDDIDLSNYATKDDVSSSISSSISSALSEYNKTSNFKTINNQSIIGTGNISIDVSVDIESISNEEIDNLFKELF